MFVSIPHAAVQGRAVGRAGSGSPYRGRAGILRWQPQKGRPRKNHDRHGSPAALVWPGQTASDLCRAAAESLLAAHPSCRDEVDALVFVSQSPDYDLPATACILQQRLGLPQTLRGV